MEEKHKCKLCSRTFAHGRSLGGHMKSHFATLPLPPKSHQPTPPSPSSFSSSSAQNSDNNDKSLTYTLRENPRKSFKLSDPTSSVIIQDRESETESKSPPRLRSKRIRTTQNPYSAKKHKQNNISHVSSVSEEDVAMCLIMLSRDKWKRKVEDDEMKVVKKGVRGKSQCQKCKKTLGSHRNVCSCGHGLVFECPFCFKVFGSGQALGGHKRSHLVKFSSSSLNDDSANLMIKESFIDLNLPAPQIAGGRAEDELSVVSDA